MENEKIKKILKELEKNAIFKLSLSSNELFHSNFWHWLLTKYFDTNPEIIGVFYSEADKNKVEKNFNREKGHTDLSFKCDEKLIIIENKIKSYSNIDQLIKYASANKNNLGKIILISYFKPIFLKKLPEGLEKISDKEDYICKYSENDNDEINNKSFLLEYVSYKKLQERLEKFFDNIKASNDDEIENKYIIQNYIKCLKLLNQLKEEIEEKTEKYDMYNLDLNAFQDIYVKYRTAELAEYIEDNLEYDIEVNTDFSHKHGIINIIINDKNEKNYDFRVQIEHKQFRLCIFYYKAINFDKLKNISKDILEKKLWFYYTKEHNIDFCKYGEQFIYRYRKMSELFNKELSEISYEEITKQLKNIIEKFIENKNEIKECMNKIIHI